MDRIDTIVPHITPRRRIEGQSAVLLPFRADGRPDYDAFADLVRHTIDAGLVPAVNMDTGYVNHLTEAERGETLGAAARALAGRPFTAGAFIEGKTGAPADLYLRAAEPIVAAGGTPILFQCSALKSMGPKDVVAVYAAVGRQVPRFLAFELGEMFVPFGSIYTIEVVRELMRIPTLAGMKHSSLSRRLEWERLALRDRVRPDFKIYTGNDLAIDMVMYGSDYLLGLSAFAPEAFAHRDRMWEAGDSGFYELNDLLQYLGHFAFRPPVPAYKHSAAMFLKLRGRLACDVPHPAAPRRPDSDRGVLEDIASRLEALLKR